MSETVLRPLLRRVPDARQSRAYLIDPILFPYLALLFGLPVVVLLACYNAAALRRFRLFFAGLAVGVAGWIAFLLSVSVLRETAFALVAGRAMNFVVGCFFYFLQRHHIRGHAFLGGSLVPLRPFYIGALFVAVLMPPQLARLLLGVPFG